MGEVTRFRRLKWAAPERLPAPWPRRRSALDGPLLPLAAFVLSAVVGWLVLSGTASRWLDTLATARASAGGTPVSAEFSLCSEARGDCVVDGDTFDYAGHRYRIADIDTPEVFSPGCTAERERGEMATLRLRELLNQGPFELVQIDRDEDVYGRKLRIVRRDGRSLGDRLVAEDLAHVWDGRKHPWC